eukprot:scaffold86945_cov51-Phaeocystis_antarctica.AAC.1
MLGLGLGLGLGLEDLAIPRAVSTLGYNDLSSYGCRPACRQTAPGCRASSSARARRYAPA